MKDGKLTRCCAVRLATWLFPTDEILFTKLKTSYLSIVISAFFANTLFSIYEARFTVNSPYMCIQ